MAGKEFVYPTYARAERIADGIMHVVGVTGALIGAALLLAWAFGHGSPTTTTAIAIYAATLVATFAASAVYHMSPWAGARPILRRLDHAAIYFKIAGTYTPLVVLLGSAMSYFVLATVWALALGGAALKLFFWRNPNRYGTGLYLLIGWLSVLIIWPATMVLPAASVWLIVAGGLIYTCGVVFFLWDRLKFSNAIWHGLVVVASACFFAAIAIGMAAQA